MRRHEAWKGHGEVSFDPQPPPDVAYEPKGCEMCPRTFLRQIGSRARYCPPCMRLPKMEPPTLSAMNPARENGSSLGPVTESKRSGYHRRLEPEPASVADAKAAIHQIERSAGVQLQPWQRQIVVQSFRRKTVH